MKTLLIVITLAISLFSDFVYASKKHHTLDLNLLSFHTQRCYSECTKNFNEINFGFTISYDSGYNFSVFSGTLRNSFNNQSVYIGVNPYFDLKFLGDNSMIRTGLLLGVVNGYADTIAKSTIHENGDVAPIVSPNISLFYHRLHLNFGVVPSSGTTVFTSRVGVWF